MFPATTRILIIDDMSTMRQLVKAQLRTMGFKNFYEAENGEQAFGVLQAQTKAQEGIELVLSDWNMPQLTGIDLLKRVRATPEYKELPFMLITAEGEQSQVLDAIKAGVSNYLVKPFTPASIQEKIAAVWKKHFGAKGA
jgi:two-component system, chemotaxis family, chemotaxis protein CheY